MFVEVGNAQNVKDGPALDGVGLWFIVTLVVNETGQVVPQVTVTE